MEDTINWKWTALGCYSASSAYHIQFVGGILDVRYNFIWGARTENKCRFFGWLMVQKKILTVDKLQLRGWSHSLACVMCGLHAETAGHLMMDYAFAKQLWS